MLLRIKFQFKLCFKELLLNNNEQKNKNIDLIALKEAIKSIFLNNNFTFSR